MEYKLYNNCVPYLCRQIYAGESRKKYLVNQCYWVCILASVLALAKSLPLKTAIGEISGASRWLHQMVCPSGMQPLIMAILTTEYYAKQETLNFCCKHRKVR